MKPTLWASYLRRVLVDISFECADESGGDIVISNMKIMTPFGNADTIVKMMRIGSASSEKEHITSSNYTTNETGEMQKIVQRLKQESMLERIHVSWKIHAKSINHRTNLAQYLSVLSICIDFRLRAWMCFRILPSPMSLRCLLCLQLSMRRCHSNRMPHHRQTQVKSSSSLTRIKPFRISVNIGPSLKFDCVKEWLGMGRSDVSNAIL